MNKKKSAISIQSEKGEVWKDIPGWEGLYQVSTSGRVWSVRRRKLLSLSNSGLPTKDGQRYLSVGLSIQKVYAFKVHRLVAMTFLDNPENKPYINHIDSDRRNNSLENLEWATRDENMAHAAKSGRMKNNKPLQRVYKFTHLNGDFFYIIGYEQIKKHFNYKGNPWEVMPRITNTGVYAHKGKMKGFKVDSFNLKDQRLFQEEVGLSRPKQSASVADEDIVCSHDESMSCESGM